MMFKNWLEAFIKLHGQLPDKAGIACPSCGSLSIDYQYVGDANSRVGYLALWCDKCLTGIQLSRVEAPQSVELMPFDSPDDVLQKRIPNFRQIVPK
jgi:hypothetical protein